MNNCAAGGYYDGADAARTPTRPFVMVERNGRWGKAEEAPGISALGTDASVTTVSCAPGGYCVAGMSYADRYAHLQPFVATFKKGRWQAALEVPGTKVRFHKAFLVSVSCPAARRCVVAGVNFLGVFVASQVRGVWRAAQTLPGMGGVNALSCWSAGNCVAGGPEVVSEVNGVWGTPVPVPGAGADAGVTSVSCARDGYCAAVGSDFPGTFAVTAVNGVWSTSVTWPHQAPVLSVSCPSAGSCAAAGYRANSTNDQYAFVVSQTNGVWGTPEALPGSGTDVEITSLSCGSAGNCGAGGNYLPAPGRRTRRQPFVASETNGRWTGPEPVPGVLVLNRHRAGQNGVFAVSCPSAGHCTAAGTYTDAEQRHLPFVTGPA